MNKIYVKNKHDKYIERIKKSIKMFDGKIEKGNNVWVRISGYKILLEKVLAPIKLNSYTYKCYKFSTKDKLYPVKVRVFSSNPMLEIAISFNNYPKYNIHD